ncbi:MAG: hypothetical protein K1X64_04655 [Myxococcaceae bacterium]|nr:hypothetical protein [Myxococcaceae bacterium]
MRPCRFFAIVAGFISAAASAQAINPQGWSAPPMVPSPVYPPSQPGLLPPPPPMPLPDVPSAHPVGKQPSGYPYAGQQGGLAPQPQGPEVGLMVTESLFGMLTAAGVTLLPYYLLVKPFIYTGGLGPDPTAATVVFCLLFSTVPLAVSQAQLSLANGSKYYDSESWPAALSGLAAQSLVLGVFFLTGGLPEGQLCNQSGTCSPVGLGSELVLLVGSIAFTPLVQMAVINLTKSLRLAPPKATSGLFIYDGERWALGVPSPTAVPTRTSSGYQVGFRVPLLSGVF